MIIQIKESQSVRMLKRTNQANLIFALFKSQPTIRTFFEDSVNTAASKLIHILASFQEIHKEILQRQKPSSLLEFYLMFYESEQ